MRALSSSRFRFTALTAALALAAGTISALCLQPIPALADKPQGEAGSSVGAFDASLASQAHDDAPLAADGLGRRLACLINWTASLNDETPLLGSFTIDGMTYAVTGEGAVQLAVAMPDVLAASLAGASDAKPVNEFDSTHLAIPESVGHDGITYSVTSIGPRAFVGCDADVVRVPASVESVDEAAFRGSSVGGVEVAEGNPNLASYEGVLYDADLKSLLLIPEGKQGAVRIPKTVEVVPADAFSHCASVTAIEADAGSAAPDLGDAILQNYGAPTDKDPACSLKVKEADRFLEFQAEDLVLNSPMPEVTELSSYLVASAAAQIISLGPGITKIYSLRDDGSLGTLYQSGPTYRESLATYFSLRSDGRFLRTYPNTFRVVLLAQPNAHCEFIGWFRDKSCSQPYRAGDTIAETGCYALFSEKALLASFNANGGHGGQQDPIEVTPGLPMPAISSEKPIRDGYEFVGWYDDPDFMAPSAVQYYTADCESARTWDKSTDATLYAGWKALSYSISYDDQSAAPDTYPASYTIEDADFTLPTPARYGYKFDGWLVEGAQGTGVETVDGVTTVRQGTYGDLTCTAQWTLCYDMEVPVCSPGSVTFEADSTTGEVRVAPGSSAEGAIRSHMAAPVALDSLACEGLPARSGSGLELEALFGPGSASQVRFIASFGDAPSAPKASLCAGGSASLAGLTIPAAAAADAPGELAVAYGLELDEGLPIPSLREAAPVARLVYTVSLPLQP